MNNNFKKLLYKMTTFIMLLALFLVICVHSTKANNSININYLNSNTLNSQLKTEYPGNLYDMGWTVINDKKISLEIASDNDTRAKGLMFRDSLPEMQGMVFIFDKPNFVSFWMKNVKISLDMIFISNSKIVNIYKGVVGCKKEPCEIYPSNFVIDSVVELNGGFCQKYNIKIGQKVKFSPNIQNKIIQKTN